MARLERTLAELRSANPPTPVRRRASERPAPRPPRELSGVATRGPARLYECVQFRDRLQGAVDQHAGAAAKPALPHL